MAKIKKNLGDSVCHEVSSEMKDVNLLSQSQFLYAIMYQNLAMLSVILSLKNRYIFVYGHKVNFIGCSPKETVPCPLI